MALLQNAQIVVNNHGTDNTLRGVAMNMGIPAITLEVGDPNQFQKGVIRSGLTGIFNVLTDLGIVEDHEIEDPHEPAVLCKSSYWLYTDKGGMLDVFPRITEKVRKGDKIARIRNVFGDLIKEYFAPEDGIVIGKSTQPVGQTGARILHLGIME
jgi:predicted deacylase